MKIKPTFSKWAFSAALSAVTLGLTAQGGEATAQKLLPRRTAPVVFAAPFAHDVNGNHVIVRRDSGRERGVVGDAQIAPEPMKSGGHAQRYGELSAVD